MSYARKGLDGSSVYVYATGNDWRCHGCALAGAGHVVCESPADMVAHLERHRAAGHAVPAAAIERLTSDAGKRCIAAGYIDAPSEGES